jgi:outer membrane protein
VRHAKEDKNINQYKMKKNNFFKATAIAAFAVLSMTACDKSAPQVDEKASTAKQAEPGELKIAFVEVDSIMSQYQFCKDFTQILQKKGQNIQNTLANKQQQLENAAANFQQKLQQNAYTREQAEGIQASLQKQSNDLQALNQRLSTEFQTETDKYNSALRDSIQHFLAVYNKQKKFSIILSKAGDNILYADKAYDITNEVIAGLNKAYKPAKPAAKKETEEKKKQK